jgi:hypothetical protein
MNEFFNDLELTILSEIHRLKRFHKRDFELSIIDDYIEDEMSAFTVRCLRYQSINTRFEHKTYSADSMQLLYLCNI